VHSFTSNSNDRLPALKWRKIIVALALLVTGFFFIWNAVWMSYGYRIQPRDDAALWIYQRQRVSSAGKDAIVLTGSSRIRAGIDLNEIRRITGKAPFQLAVGSGSPMPVLENLAADESFNGTVIAEVTEYLLYPDLRDSTTDRWLAEYERDKQNPDYLFPLKNRAKSLIIHPEIGNTVPEMLENVYTGKFFDADFLRKVSFGAPPKNNFERSWQGYHDHLSPAQIEQRRQISTVTIREAVEKAPPDPAKFAELVRRIKSYVERIKSRGGKVVFVSFPMGEEVRELNERFFPKNEFWDVIAEESFADTVYYPDYPQLASIETMDGTHLSGGNATRFTDELLKIIEPAPK
jgi:hypothetical protein